MLVPVERASELKEGLASELEKFRAAKKPIFADLRLEISNGIYAEALNGMQRGAGKDYGIEIGVRVYSGKTPAMGFAGKSLGTKDAKNPGKILKGLLDTAFRRANASARKKDYLKKRFALEASGLYATELAEQPTVKKNWEKKFRKNPLDASIEDFVGRSEKISKDLSKMQGIAANGVTIVSMLGRKIYANTEGSIIEQTRAITEPSVYIAAKGKAEETYHEWIAEAKGLEALDGDNAHAMTIEEFAEHLAKGTVELSNAPAAKFEKNVTVVTDPWFNTLLSHEVCGHPLEADRALKRETAWAGRAWWYADEKNNMLGKQVGSEDMTIVSDPSAEGYGNYAFDDEGIAGKKTTNIESGVLKEFMNSRETSLILGEKANGHMRAASASMVPLIRMSCTHFGAGSWKAQELIEDTRDGYYIVGLKTPSIGESRQNFNITCWKCYKIENGEIGQLYRQAGIESDSFEFFKTIEAADDVKLYNVPNCGKGTPMQTMKLGNGGPHIRGKANLTGKRD